MQIQLRKTTLKIDILTFLFAAIGWIWAGGREVTVLAASLSIHELAHLAAAKVLCIDVGQIRLTPFGGMARIDNPYVIPPMRLFAMAAAGPLANLILIMVIASLNSWLGLHATTAALLIRINATLMLFNLVPVLPLDGGRMLYAVLSLIMPRAKAVNAAIWLGRLFSLLLILFAAYGVFLHGQLNLSPLFAAVFILASASDERRALSDSHIRGIIRSTQPILNPTHAELIAIDASISPENALRAARPDRITLFAVYNGSEFSGIVDDRTLIARILHRETHH